VPAAFAHNYYSKRGKNIEHDITNFLRDLTEARKTGASPEKCLENLAGRNYGAFTQHLNVASRQIRWGLPFKTVYETFRAKIKSWMGLINMYVLVDAIEVGGGTPETLETLTRFSERLSSIEKERKSTLKPLVLMPYIGVAILLFSNIIFLNFMGSIMGSFASQSIAFSDFATLIMPPLVLQAFLTGLVSGKISTGQTSAGFKHAALLVILGVVLMVVIGLFSNLLTIGFQETQTMKPDMTAQKFKGKAFKDKRAVSNVISTIILTGILLTVLLVAMVVSTNILNAQLVSTEFNQAQSNMLLLDSTIQDSSLRPGAGS
jgi:pilus assembly protein TadC